MKRLQRLLTDRRLGSFVAWAYLVVALALLLDPRPPEPWTPDDWPHVDKVEHAVLFAGLVFCFGWAGWRGRALVLALAVALSTEAAQAYWLAERSGDPFDLIANAVGIVLGWLAWSASERRVRS